MIYYVEPSEEEKVSRSLEKELHSVYRQLESCQHRSHSTAFGVGMMAFIAGFCICWLVFIR